MANPKINWGVAEIEQIKMWREAGLNVDEIAKKLNCSRETCYKKASQDRAVFDALGLDPMRFKRACIWTAPAAEGGDPIDDEIARQMFSFVNQSDDEPTIN